MPTQDARKAVRIARRQCELAVKNIRKLKETPQEEIHWHQKVEIEDETWEVVIKRK